MEEKWIVLLLFLHWQIHGKIRTIQIMLFFTATVEASILLLSILRSLRGWASDFLTVKGLSFDNAPMESFHSVLKKEEVYLKHYSSFYEANIRLFDYINGFYNLNRIHWLLIICHPFILKKSFTLIFFLFRLFVSRLLTMVQ